MAEYRMIGFDLEIAEELPEDGNIDWTIPLGVTCAALATEDHSQWAAPDRVGDEYGARISDIDKLVTWLEHYRQRGYYIVTWNGMGFDFRVLAHRGQDGRHVRRTGPADVAAGMAGAGQGAPVRLPGCTGDGRRLQRPGRSANADLDNAGGSSYQVSMVPDLRGRGWANRAGIRPLPLADSQRSNAVLRTCRYELDVISAEGAGDILRVDRDPPVRRHERD